MDAHRQLPHQRLTISRALACNNKVGILDDFAEVDDVEQ
jgi:ABC-type phosphate transport system ATPase subunit